MNYMDSEKKMVKKKSDILIYWIYPRSN